MLSTHQIIMYIVALLALVHLIYSGYVMTQRTSDKVVHPFTIVSILVNAIIIALAVYCSTLHSM